MPTLAQRAEAIKAFFLNRIPTKRVTRYNTRNMPTSLASMVTVDDVHDTLRAAEQGDVTRLFALYQEILATDSHLQGRFADRKEAVLGDTLTIQPYDKYDTADILAATAIEQMIADLGDQKWERACAHLLDSVLWPVAITEKTFRQSTRPGLRYELSELTPVPYQLLSYIKGTLELLPTDPDTGNVHAGAGVAPELARYIIHRGHLLSLPDNWGGPMRSIVFWWLLSMMSRDWWARFLDRYGGPFLIGKYDQADDASRSVLLGAFQLSQKLGGLVVSKETDVEIKQAATTDTGEAYKTFIDLCNREKSKLILGETLSSDAQAGGGMNSGNAELQGEKRQDKRQSDARRLGATLREGLFTQYLRINGIPGRAPKAIWGTISSAEMGTTGTMIQNLAAGGLRIGDAGLETLSERIGLPVERMPAAPAPSGPFAFSAPAVAPAAQNAIDLIAQKSASDLAKSFRGSLAPIRDIILVSKTPEEAIAGVQAFCSRFDPSRAARVMEEALVAITANAASKMGR